MIESVELINFQSHRKSTISLTPGVNVITGTSDSGKSSILRSLLWVIQNRPSGDSIKNWDCKKDDEVAVQLDLNNGSIAKERVNGKAKYLLDLKEGSFEFEAFKTDIPKEIEDVLNLSELNIQTQHTPYFLLNDSPGEVARKLNEIVHLDIIDRIFKNLNSKILEAKRLMDLKEKQEGELTNEIENLEYLDDINSILVDLSNSILAYDNSKQKCTEIQSLCKTIEDTDNEVRDFKDIVGLENRTSSLISQAREYQTLKENYDKVSSLVKNIQELTEKTESERDWLTVEKPVISINDSILAYKTLKSSYDAVKNAVGDLNELEKDISDAKNRSVDLEKKLKSFLLKHKKCPVCYQTITEDVIDRIVL